MEHFEGGIRLAWGLNPYIRTYAAKTPIKPPDMNPLASEIFALLCLTHAFGQNLMLLACFMRRFGVPDVASTS